MNILYVGVMLNTTITFNENYLLSIFIVYQRVINLLSNFAFVMFFYFFLVSLFKKKNLLKSGADLSKVKYGHPLYKDKAKRQKFLLNLKIICFKDWNSFN